MPNQIQTQPQPPEGCKHLWWDSQLELWFYCNEEGVVHYLLFDTWIDNGCRNSTTRQLLVLAAERDELRAENERLKAENQSQKATIAHIQAGTMPTWKDLKGPAK